MAVVLSSAQLLRCQRLHIFMPILLETHLKVVQPAIVASPMCEAPGTARVAAAVTAVTPPSCDTFV